MLNHKSRLTFRSKRRFVTSRRNQPGREAPSRRDIYPLFWRFINVDRSDKMEEVWTLRTIDRQSSRCVIVDILMNVELRCDLISLYLN